MVNLTIINTITFHNPDMRPLCYPLLFPYGQRIFHSGIPLNYPTANCCKNQPDDMINDDIVDDEKIESEDDDDQLAYRVI